MQNLEEKIGFKVLLKDDNTLEFGDDIEVEQLSARSFNDLMPVVADENLKLGDDPAYFMYRNVRQSNDEEVLRSNNLRFDLTVMPSALLGEEFVKTSGHYHPTKPGTEFAYPELYYVASGQATYLMQKKDSIGSIEDVIVCRVKAGEAIVMPPGYGHVTVNELPETLVMANWVSDSFKSIYDDYETLRGGSYYIFKQGKNSSIQKNELYDAPNYREVLSGPIVINEHSGIPIYQFIEHVRDLSFLNKPEESAEKLQIENLFKQM